MTKPHSGGIFAHRCIIWTNLVETH